MDISLSDFTNILDDDEDSNSSPLSLSIIQENNPEKTISTEDNRFFNLDGNDRPLKYTAQSGEKRSTREIPSKYRHLFPYQHFNVIQSKIMDDALYTDKSLVVSAPTGSGKTVVLEMTIVQLLMQLEDIKYTGDFKIIYISPVKALCTERLTDWYSKFLQLGLLCIQVTGDTNLDFCDLKPYKIIITTPEKWDMLTRRWVANKYMVEVIKLFIIDEVHLLNDSVRGPVLEAVVSRMKIIEASVEIDRRVKISKAGASLKVQILPSGIRYVAISATIDNPEDVAQWLDSKKKPAVFYKMGDECRPVRLRKIVEGYPCAAGTSPFKFDMTLGYKLWPVIEKYFSGKPALIFCSTRKSVCMTADTLMREITFQFNLEHKAKLNNIASHIQDKKLQALVVVGVGCHHAGYVYEDRHCIEQAFRNGDLPILVTTTTLAMGVNLPANLVIIKSTQQYINGAYQEYSLSTILQMMGRAGRPQFDSEGTAVIMTRMQDKARYTSMVSGAEPLESSLHRRMAEHLNSEIALGAVVDLAVAAEWARSTFLHVRATRQPRRYLGLPDDAPPERVDKKIEGLCMVAINALSRHGMITFDEAVCVTSTDAGRLMSLYCLNLETMKLIMKINGNEALKDMLFLVCEGHEFSDLPLRVNEKNCLNTLNRSKSGENIRFQLKGKISTRQMKVNCILQAVFGCIQIPDPALNQESIKILRIAERITSCIVCYLTRASFLSTRPAYLTSLLSALTVAQCATARLWESSPHVARQLRGIGPAYGAALARSGKTTFQHIRDANPRDLERIMNKGPPAGNILKQQVSLLPIYIIQLQNEAESILVRLSIQNYEELQVQGTEQLTAGPHHKIYLLAGDEDNNLLMFHCLRDKQLIQMFDGTITKTFQTVNTNEHKVIVHCVSAAFVGLDVSAEMTVQAQKTIQKVQQNITKFFSTQDTTNNSNSTNIHTSYYEAPKVSQTHKVGQTPKITELFKQKKNRNANGKAEPKPTPKTQKCTPIQRLDSFRDQFSLNRATQQCLEGTTTMPPPRTQLLPPKSSPLLQNPKNTLHTTQNDAKTNEISKIENVNATSTQNIDVCQNLTISSGISWLNNISESYSDWMTTLKNTHMDMTFEKVDKHFDSMIQDLVNNIDNADKNSNDLNSINKDLNQTNKSIYEKHNHFNDFPTIGDNFKKQNDNYNNLVKNSNDNSENMNVNFLLEQIEKEMRNDEIVQQNNLHIETVTNKPDNVAENQEECILLNEKNNETSNIYDNSADILRSLKSQYKRSIENTSFKDIMKPDVKKRKTNDTLNKSKTFSETIHGLMKQNNIYKQNNLDKTNTSLLAIKREKSDISSELKTFDHNVNFFEQNPNQITPVDSLLKKRNERINTNISLNEKRHNTSAELFNEIPSLGVINIEKLISVAHETDDDMFSTPVENNTELQTSISHEYAFSCNKNIEKSESFSNISKDETLGTLRKSSSDLVAETKKLYFIHNNNINDAKFDDNIIFSNIVDISEINEVPSKVTFTPTKLDTKAGIIVKNNLNEKECNKFKSIYSEESEIAKNNSLTKKYDNNKPTENFFVKSVNDNIEEPNNYESKIVKASSNQSLIPMINSSVSDRLEKITRKLPTIYEMECGLVPSKLDLFSEKQLLLNSKKKSGSYCTQISPLSANNSDTILDNFTSAFNSTIFQKQPNESTKIYKQNISNKNIIGQNEQNCSYKSSIGVDIERKTITIEEKVKVHRTYKIFEKNNKYCTDNFDANSQINIEKLCSVKKTVCRSSQIQSTSKTYTRENQNLPPYRNVLKNLPICVESDNAMTEKNQGFSNVHKNIVPKYFSIYGNTELETTDVSENNNEYFNKIPIKNIVCKMQGFSNAESFKVNIEENVPQNYQQFPIHETESGIPKTGISMKEESIPNIHKKFSENKNEICMKKQNTSHESTEENISESFVDTTKINEKKLLKINDKEPVVLITKSQCVPIISYDDVIRKEENNIVPFDCSNNDGDEIEDELPKKKTDAVMTEIKIDEKMLPDKTKSIGNDIFRSSNFVQDDQKESARNPGIDSLVLKVLQKFQTRMQVEDQVGNEDISNFRNTHFNAVEQQQNDTRKKPLQQKPKRIFHIGDIHHMAIDLSKFIDSNEPISQPMESTQFDFENINKSNSYLNTLLNPPIPKPGRNNAEQNNRYNLEQDIMSDLHYDGINLANITNKVLVEDKKSASPIRDVGEIVESSEMFLDENLLKTHDDEKIKYYAPSSFKTMFERYSNPNAEVDNNGDEIFPDLEEYTQYESLMSQSLSMGSKFEDYDAIKDTFRKNKQISTSEVVYSPLEFVSEIIPPLPQFDDQNSPNKLQNPYPEISAQKTHYEWNNPHFNESIIKKNSFDQEIYNVWDEKCYEPLCYKQMFAHYSERDNNINDIPLSCYNDTERLDSDNLNEIHLYKLDDFDNNEMFHFPTDIKLDLSTENPDETHSRNKRKKITNRSSNVNGSPVFLKNNETFPESISSMVGLKYSSAVTRKNDYDKLVDTKNKLESFKLVKKRIRSHKPVDSNGLLPTWRASKHISKMKNHFHK